MNLQKGTFVTITNNLVGSTTESIHHLDLQGNMLRMEGKTFPIEFVNMSSVRIVNHTSEHTYTFSKKDISIYSEDLPPKEFKFDEQLLDI